MENRKAFFERLDHLLDQYLDDPDFSFETIYQELGVSRSQLVRVLKEHTGITLSQYVRRYRLEKAKELLRTTDWRIVEITAKIGLDSPQTLTKYFTQEYGLSPTEYRKSSMVIEQVPGNPTVGEEEQLSDISIEPVANVSLPLRLRPRYIVLGSVGFLLLATFFYLRFSENILQSPGKEGLNHSENSIAILPFKNDKEPETIVIAEGLLGQIHASLVSIGDLKVISRMSSGMYEGTGKTIPQIGKELGVQYLLLGEVIRNTKKVLVRVELIEAAGDRTVWTDNFEGDFDEMLPTMNSLARQLMRVLDQKISASESRKMDKIPTQNVAVYREYVLGKQLIASRTPEKLKASIVRFDRALALEPDFADAYASKASAFFLLGGTVADPREYIRLSEQYALKAIRLDGENGLAYATLANGYRMLNKWEQAVTTYQIALKHSPNDAQINYWYSIALRALGLYDEAIKYSSRALALDPLYATVVAGHIGNYSYAGRFEEAEKLLKDYELTLNDFFIYYYVKAYYYLNQNDYNSALKEFLKCKSLNPNDQSVSPSLQFCRARVGQLDSVQTYLATQPDTPAYYTTRAIVYAGLKDKDRCLKYLQLGATLGITAEYLKVSPLFRFLHGDPRFEKILRQLGLLNVSI